MRTKLTLLFLLSAPLAACARGNSGPFPDAPNADVSTFNAATVEIVAEGGFAAITTDHLVRHDDRHFLYRLGHICSSNCPAALDSASGTLAPAATDSLFIAILAQSPFSLSDDYGTTKGGADMMNYTLRITAGGSTKTIRADDGTMPTQMRRIVDAVHQTISKAKP
jgi:hypothetical protein